jgi:hypothetical protein
MNVNQFVYQNRLQPADVVVVKKNFPLLHFLDHYLVYMGQYDDGRHWFMANMAGGVRWISQEELVDRSGNFWVERIRHFGGSHWQRQDAVKKAQSLEGKSYSFWNFNCENYANVVQTGQNYSLQVHKAQQVGNGLALTAAVFAFGALLAAAFDDE